MGLQYDEEHSDKAEKEITEEEDSSVSVREICVVVSAIGGLVESIKTKSGEQQVRHLEVAANSFCL